MTLPDTTGAGRFADAGQRRLALEIAMRSWRISTRFADLFLDTLQFNAMATGCDALWAGPPPQPLEVLPQNASRDGSAADQ